MNPEFASGGFLGRETSAAQSTAEVRTLFDCGTCCLMCGRVGDAYACYARIREADSAVWFNRALCLKGGGEYNEAVECLLRADVALSAPAPMPLRPANRLQTLLDECDAMGEGYLRPMAWDMPRLFPDEARRQILRVMVDVGCLAGRYDEVRRIAARLGRHYKNVDTILEQLKTRQ